MTSTTIYFADDEQAIRRCWPVMRELRPHLSSADALVERFSRQAGQGYRLAYVLEDDEVAAVAGFRFMHTLAWGRTLYIDDLVARACRPGAGLGTQVLAFQHGVARDAGCDAVHLDTGFHRTRAHRTYLRNRFEHEGFHMARTVDRGGGGA
jgi:GNAT superfamily N-acetyltransferase